MNEDIFIKLKELEKSVRICFRDGLLDKSTHDSLINEITILFPYVNFSAYRNVIIKQELIENKVKILDEKFKKCVLKKGK